MTNDPAERVEELGFDEILQRLRKVVGQLEAGNLGLEESLRMYEQGVNLARRGHVLLDGAEKRVELLTRDPRGGLTTMPFEATSDGESEESAREEDDRGPERGEPPRRARSPVRSAPNDR